MNLQEFSARTFGPEKIPDPFSEHFRKSWPDLSEISEMDQKSTTGKVNYGLFWVAVGPFGLEMVPYESELVWNPIGPLLDPIWVTYGPVLAHFCVFGLLLDFRWLVPIVALLLPYCSTCSSSSSTLSFMLSVSRLCLPVQ